MQQLIRCLAPYPVVLLALCLSSASAMADSFAAAHRAEIREMTAAGVRFREEFQKYNRKLYEGLEKGSPAFNEAGRLSADCYWLIYSRFYVKFRNVIDKLNTSPLKYPDDIDEGRGDEIIHDPKKIVVLTRKVIGDIWYLEGTGRSAGDFAAEYARRPEFEKKCEGYLDATGLR